MTNIDYINAYKSESKILSDFYKIKDSSGNVIDLTGIVNPLKIDNRQIVAPIDDQTDTPHCGGFSAATLVETLYWKNTGKLLQLDSHQVYAKAKTIDGQTNMEGTYLEAALRAVTSLCDFDFIKNAKIKTFPNIGKSTADNVKFLIHKHDILQAGFLIDLSWMRCNCIDYVIHGGQSNCGGHAVNIVGYDTTGFYIANQWGRSWGANGFAVMPYDVFQQQFMYCAYLDI